MLAANFAVPYKTVLTQRYARVSSSARGQKPVRQRSKAGGEPVRARRRKAATPKLRTTPKSISDRRLSAAGPQELLDHRTRELNEALRQQTATSEVFRVIRRAPFDLQNVLDTLVQLAVQLCEAKMANIWRPKDGVYHVSASSQSKEYVNTRNI